MDGLWRSSQARKNWKLKEVGYFTVKLWGFGFSVKTWGNWANIRLLLWKIIIDISSFSSRLYESLLIIFSMSPKVTSERSDGC